MPKFKIKNKLLFLLSESNQLRSGKIPGDSYESISGSVYQVSSFINSYNAQLHLGSHTVSLFTHQIPNFLLTDTHHTSMALLQSTNTHQIQKFQRAEALELIVGKYLSLMYYGTFPTLRKSNICRTIILTHFPHC